MDGKELSQILNSVAEAEINELVLETAEYKLSVKRGVAETVYVQQPAAQMLAPAAAPVQAAPASVPASEASMETSSPAAAEEAPKSNLNLIEITAPIVGTFYSAPTPDAPLFVKEGDKVTAGTVMCIIEAMKLMNEIEAEVTGTVAEIMVRNEEPVEYGQVLFTIDPD